ncbi:MAG TPA: hypothetical protein VGH36_03055 [Acetobacteraceae bacterium]
MSVTISTDDTLAQRRRDRSVVSGGHLAAETPTGVWDWHGMAGRG